jgi:cytochrome P450
LGRNPDQYALLRENPSLISNAVYESMRFAPPVRWVARVAIEDYRAGEVFIPAGERIMLLFAAANRDPRKYPEPNSFDVTRRPADQLGWGAGPHICAGMHLARMELEVLLESMVKRVARFEVGEPVRSTNRGLYGIESLKLRMIPS